MEEVQVIREKEYLGRNRVEAEKLELLKDVRLLLEQVRKPLPVVSCPPSGIAAASPSFGVVFGWLLAAWVIIFLSFVMLR